jgi:hypothetical protein
MTTRGERWRMMRDRTCYVCLQPIPEAGGVVHGSLWIITHRECNDVVEAQYKDFSRSKRGRFRPASDVRRRVEEAREVREVRDVRDSPLSLTRVRADRLCESEKSSEKGCLEDNARSRTSRTSRTGGQS